MSGRRPFDRGELGTASRADLDDALEMAHRLEATPEPISPSAGFADRVMAALADEPAPVSAGFLAPLHRRGILGGFVASVRQAWRSVGGAGRPMLVRASALAYVLAVVIAGTSLAGVATVGVAGALGIFRPGPTPSLDPVSPGPTLAPPQTSVPSPSEPSGESAPPQPSATAGPSASPRVTDDHGGNSGPGSSGSGSDDSSGSGSSGSGSDDNSGPGSSGSGSGSDDGSGSGATATPRASSTPRPTGTPKPSETPH